MLQELFNEIEKRVTPKLVFEKYLYSFLLKKNKYCKKHTILQIEYMTSSIYRTKVRRLDEDLAIGDVHRNSYGERLQGFIRNDYEMKDIIELVNSAESDYKTKKARYHEEPCYCE